MAKVMVPVQPRIYNHNPRGSATAVVTMKGNNPFERALAGPEGLVQVRAGIMPGMGYWGLGDSQNTPSNPEFFTLDPGGENPAAPSFVPADLTAFAVPTDTGSNPIQTPATMSPLTAQSAYPQPAPSATPVFQSTFTPQSAPNASGVPHAGGAAAVAPASNNSFWAGLTSSILSAGATITAPIVANQLAKNKSAAAAANAVKPFLPGTNVPAPKKTSMTTYLVLGGIGVAAIVAIAMIMRKKSA
jgi:hypothetical protein